MPSPTLPPPPSGSSTNLTCLCGGRGHLPQDHPWDQEQIGRAAHRSAKEVQRDRLKNDDCPLNFGSGGRSRGSRKLIWHWAEVQAYMRWRAAKDLAQDELV